MEASEQAFLPSEVVRQVQALALNGEPNPSSRLLMLLSMCGVCHQWRRVCCALPESTSLSLDGLETPQTPGGVLSQFRRAPVSTKTAVFEAAAGLLHGYGEASLSGEAVTDAVLRALASRNGAVLTALRMQGAPAVTDSALSALFAAAPRLRSVQLSGLGRHVTGAFLPALLGSCRQLQSLHISGAPGIDWGAMDWELAVPAPAPAHDAGPAPSAAAQDAAAAPQEPAAAVDQPWPASLGAVAAPSSSGRGPALSPPPSPMQQHQQQQRPFPLGPGADGAAPGHDAEPGRSGGSRGSCSVDAAVGGSSSGGAPGGVGASRAISGNVDSGGSDSGSNAVGGTRGHDASTADASSTASGSGGDTATAGTETAVPSTPASPAAADTDEQPAPGESAPQTPPPLGTVTRLHFRGAPPDGLPRLLALLPGLAELEVDGPAANIQAAAGACPLLSRLSYLAESPRDLDDALWCFAGLPGLRALEVVAKGPLIAPDQTRLLGMLPLTELRLDSWAFKQQPTLSRPAFSHVSNEGVKALVDATCARMVNTRGASPFKLSLAGATTLNHEAVSALLRLPVLTELDIAGCAKITPMDKMRLVAKCKAGREFLRLRG